MVEAASTTSATGRARLSDPQQDAQDSQNERAAPGAAKAVSLAEWLVAALGLVLVAGAIGFLAYRALVADHVPPQILASVEEIRPVRSGYLVKIRVWNEGGSTAAEVMLEGTLRRAGKVVETRTATLDYVPQHSEREVGFYFAEDPRQFDINVRAIGYREP